MTKDELIKLAQGYGWEYRQWSQELVKGTFTMDFLMSDIMVDLCDSYLDRRYPQRLENLQSAPAKPWVIGPFKEDWFSLKANRWVKP
jgi:hypothetical protein